MTHVIGHRAGQACTFRAAQRGGVWQVTRDQTFYGDYLSREAALSAACVGARSFEAAGGVAQVLVGRAESVVAHQVAARSRRRSVSNAQTARAGADRGLG